MFPKFFVMTARGHSGGGIHAFIGHLERKPAEVRIAFKRDKDTRWKISGVTGASVAEIHLQKLARSVQRGNGFVQFLHDMKIHQRQTIMPRFRTHRKAMAVARELREVEQLPTYGLF